MNILLTISIILTLTFALTNGMQDGNNIIATAISSLSLSKRKALLIVSIAEISGPFLLGISVATTVATGIINVNLLSHNMNSLIILSSSIIGAILWNFFTWIIRIPTSSSFTLVGGLIGPIMYKYGLSAVLWKNFLVKVVGALFLSPILGLFFGFFIYKIFAYLLHNATYKTNKYIKKLQIISLILLGMNHGTNDSQKTMGIIALLLFISGKTNNIHISLWIISVSALALTLGINLGGTKIIRTIGYGIFKIRPIHSLTSHISAFSILLFSNLFGAPVSTSQIISSSVIGVGSAARKNGVHWNIIKSILWSWILTIPLSAMFSSLIYIILKNLL